MQRSRLLASSAALILAAAPALAPAHAVLTRASLDGGPVEADTAVSVTLDFNTGIEPRLTKVLLVGERGEERVLAHAPGSGPGRLVVSLPPLAAGAYALRYKVLATDGHVTESVLRFRVTASE
jgi:hypothetical protein